MSEEAKQQQRAEEVKAARIEARRAERRAERRLTRTQEKRDTPGNVRPPQVGKP